MQWHTQVAAGKAAEAVQLCDTNNMSHTANFFNLKKKLERLVSDFNEMSLVHNERKQLRKLSVKELKDMGLSPDDARREAKRGFFDLPEERRNKC